MRIEPACDHHILVKSGILAALFFGLSSPYIPLTGEDEENPQKTNLKSVLIRGAIFFGASAGLLALFNKYVCKKHTETVATVYGTHW